MLTLNEREHEFKLTVFRQISFHKDILQEFFDYWSEPNKSGSKMRWELEKTWDIKRRLQRWSRTTKMPLQPVKEMKEEDKEVNYLNERLNDYARHPTSITDESLYGLYDFLKEKRLMRLNKVQVDIARAAGEPKGKALAVRMFFETMINGGRDFKHLMNEQAKR